MRDSSSNRHGSLTLNQASSYNGTSLGEDDSNLKPRSENEITNPDLITIWRDALTAIESCTSKDALEGWRISYLGRRGRLTLALRTVGSLPVEERRVLGQEANQLKKLLETEFTQRSNSLHQETRASWTKGQRLDTTLPGRPANTGRFHPITQTVKEICDTFASMGFQVVEGPEVEWEYYNFEVLNIPQDHPARDMWDTLWVDWKDKRGQRSMLLRTHTSPMQGRIMEAVPPPIRVVVPGKCYRYEATDATHESQFYQIEGLVVDKGINFAHLKGTLYDFARRIFGQDRQIRFRCDYFPFVEPGVDMSIDCFACNGNGCRICKESGWIEILGAGMVHPKVLTAVGYDPNEYTGFAFGLGPERIAMLRHGIDDIRLFYSNDIRFLRQF